MAVTITSKPYRIDNVSTQGYKVKMVFDSGTTVGTFVDADLVADDCHVIHSTLLSSTTVDISDGAPGVTVTVSADDTVYLDIIANPVLDS